MKHDDKYKSETKSCNQTQTEAQCGLFFFKQYGTWGSDGVKRNNYRHQLTDKYLDTMHYLFG